MPNEPAAPLKCGDVVSLKSGGPPMSVTKISPPEAGSTQEVVHCFWFNDDTLGVHERDFPRDCLCEAKEEPHPTHAAYARHRRGHKAAEGGHAAHPKASEK